MNIEQASEYQYPLLLPQKQKLAYAYPRFLHLLVQQVATEKHPNVHFLNVLQDTC